MSTILIVLLLVLAAIAVLLVIAWRMMIYMPGHSFQGDPPPLDAHQERVREALQQDLTRLADVIGPRDLSDHYVALIDAAAFIEKELIEAGYEPRRQEFEVDGKKVWNIDVECTGCQRADKILVVAAHYDTIPRSPGANDNGSAVVANLALARQFANRQPATTIRFAFFVNEESPYYMTEDMGALRYAKRCQADREDLIGMICLETIGYYSDEPGSQRYPMSWIGRLYPTTGNFVAVVGNVRSRRFVRRVVRHLRQSPFPIQGMAAPRWLKDSFRSDHAAFWQCGYPALMITDTANFRYAHYHTPQDTVDKIHFTALARLVTALESSVAAITS